MLGVFVLYLREGIEASLIISILFAALRQLGQMRHAKAIWTGIGLALLGAILGGLLFFFVVKTYDGTSFEQYFEAITLLLAVVLLTIMTFWMQKHSRTMKKEIIAKANSAGSGFALGLLAFTTVGREGLETAIFTIAYAFTDDSLLVLTSAALGLLASVGLAFFIYRLGYKINYGLFFRIMGILLIIFAAGLLSNALGELQEAGALRFAAQPAWDLHHLLGEESLLSEEGAIGALLHGLIGYTLAPSILQVAGYLSYLLIAGGLFTWITRRPAKKQTTSATLATPA